MTTRHWTTAPTTGMESMRKLFSLTAVAFVLAAALAPAASADHGQPYGANYGVADAVGAAWTGPLAFWAGTCDVAGANAGGTGTGSPPAVVPHCFDHGTGYFPTTDPAVPPLETVWEPTREPAWRLDGARQAGAHPDMTVSFWVKRSPDGPGNSVHSVMTEGETRTITAKLPPGFVGNPNAVPMCPSSAMQTTPAQCPPESQVGVVTVTLGKGGELEQILAPVWNVEPRDGKVAEFLTSVQFGEAGQANVPIVADARTDGDFGIDALAAEIPTGAPLFGQTITIWGVPWDPAHDKYRAPTGYAGHDPDGPGGVQPILGLPPGGLPDADGVQPESYERGWAAPVRPFLTSQTECDGVAPTTGLELVSWQDPGLIRSYGHQLPLPLTGCDDVDFTPAFEMAPTSSAADSASGLAATLTTPQNNEPPLELPDEGATDGEVSDYVEDAAEHWKTEDGLATAHLDRAVVTLPDGFTVNPSGAAGLAGCSDAQVGLIAEGNPSTFDRDDPFDGVGGECPNGSKIGTAELYTPLLPASDGEQPGDPNLTGDLVLRTPKSTDPESGDMFRLLMVLRNAERGLVVKIAGEATADKQTGQLTTTFDKSPRLPFTELSVELRGGSRGTLATPQRCGVRGWDATFTPWTAAHGGGGVPASDTGAFTASANCGFGFAPTMKAGMSSGAGGGSGAFSFQFARTDGQQWLRGLTAELPAGLVASVGSVPECTNAQAAAAACPAESRLGTVDAGAGSGTPYFLEKKGSVYLTEGYKGGAFGLATIVPVEVPPFTGAFALDTMVVRQALHVDPTDASVTAISDPFPQIWHGIPLRVRQVTVKIDRPGFMRNPTDCSAKQIVGNFTSATGTASRRAAHFQARGCRGLPFEPRMALRLTGKKQIKAGRHPGLRAAITQAPGEAAFKRATVRLPLSLALDPDNARALCEYVDGIKSDIENHCPKGSIVGRARAVSPLLDRPLTGDVYFVKNIRIHPRTGNQIRTLPMLVVALRGEIAVNLRGETDVASRGRLVNTFANVPDAPISRFALNITGGKRGILVIPRGTVCGRQVTEADMDGQNGRRHDVDVKMKTPCSKRRGARANSRKARPGRSSSGRR